MQIKQNVSLRSYNTFAVNAIAAYFVSISSLEDIQHLLSTTEFQEHTHIIIGKGSNILLTQDYSGLVIHNQILGKQLISQDEQTITIRVGAGESWHSFVMDMVEQNYAGIENLAFIPGSVGAAPIQNIGAYGVEVQSIIHSVDYIDTSDGSQHSMSASECKFAYRESIFKHELHDRAIITHVSFTLHKFPSRNYKLQLGYKDIFNYIQTHDLSEQNITLQQLANIIIAIRQAKLPDWTKIGTAGSFFKNPLVSPDVFAQLQVRYPNIPGFQTDHGIKVPAGRLIEQAKLKGLQRGPVGIYQNHALVLVNHGGATGADIVELASYIQSSVESIFDIRLEPEVQYI